MKTYTKINYTISCCGFSSGIHKKNTKSYSWLFLKKKYFKFSFRKLPTIRFCVFYNNSQGKTTTQNRIVDFCVGFHIKPVGTPGQRNIELIVGRPSYKKLQVASSATTRRNSHKRPNENAMSYCCYPAHISRMPKFCTKCLTSFRGLVNMAVCHQIIVSPRRKMKTQVVRPTVSVEDG